MPIRPGRQHSPGQALVEFAFVLIALTLLLVITIDFGRVFSAYIDIGDMAHAGAQRGTISGRLGDGNPTAAMVDAAFAEQSEIFGIVPTVAATVTADSYGFCLARVTVTYDFEPFVRFGPIPDQITLHRTSEMRTQIADPTSGCI